MAVDFETLLFGLALQLVAFVPLYLNRRAILVALISLVFKAMPKEAAANFLERTLSAYLEKKEIDIGKGKLAIQYVPTDRLKAMIEVVAPVLSSEVIKAVTLRIKKAKEEAGVGDGGIAQVLGGFLGGMGGGKGGTPDMMGLLQMFMGGGGGGGQSQMPAPPGVSRSTGGNRPV